MLVQSSAVMHVYSALHTVACDVALGLGLRDVAPALANDDTEFD